MGEIKIGDHIIGDGHKPIFIAELGICHEGSLDTALELAKAAAEAGAHMIKTESFTPRKVVFHDSAKIAYEVEGKKYNVPLKGHMEKYELSIDDHIKICKLCDSLNVPFMSTVHDFETADIMVDVGASAVKLASPDVVHYPLLRYVAKKGLPVFLDTGAALQYEVEIAVRILREAGCEKLIVNHNPSGHPAPAKNHDLRTVQRFNEILNTCVGVADHYEGYQMVYTAVAMGAHAIEKPISKDRFKPGPEINYSISAKDIKEVVDTMQEVWESLGKLERTHLSESAEAYRYNNRMVCIAAKDIEPGDKMNLENVIFGRPRMGIGVEYWDVVEGRKFRNAKKKNEFINWEDLG